MSFKESFLTPLPFVSVVLVESPLALLQKLSSRVQKIQVVSVSPPCPDFSEVRGEKDQLRQLVKRPTETVGLLGG